jgi:hypothetical protein
MRDEWRQHVSEELATQYEMGQYPDSLFNFSVSNNDGSEEGLALFKSTVGPLAHKIVTSVHQELRG